MTDADGKRVQAHWIDSSQFSSVASFSRPGTRIQFARWFRALETRAMASNTTVFFAGVGTTFMILGAGFGSGLFMANSALKDRVAVQARAKEEVPAPIRVILPSPAQAAEAKPVLRQTEHPVAPTPEVQAPVKEAQAPPEKLEKTDKKADRDKRRKRTAERKAQRLAARSNHRPETQPTERAPIMAFGGDETHSAGTANFFGN